MYIFYEKQSIFFCHTVDYKVINKFTPSNFLLTLAKFQHQTKTIHYILSQVSFQHFGKEIHKERIIINGVQLPKYRKWLILLKKIQYISKKANILH